jgi:hypothetical protein
MFSCSAGLSGQGTSVAIGMDPEALASTVQPLARWLDSCHDWNAAVPDGTPSVRSAVLECLRCIAISCGPGLSAVAAVAPSVHACLDHHFEAAASVLTLMASAPNPATRATVAACVAPCVLVLTSATPPKAAHVASLAMALLAAAVGCVETEAEAAPLLDALPLVCAALVRHLRDSPSASSAAVACLRELASHPECVLSVASAGAGNAVLDVVAWSRGKGV